MISLVDIFRARSPLQDRIDRVLSAKPASRSFDPVRASRAQDNLFFHIRPFASDDQGECLQYAFVDDRGNVIMSTFARALRPSLFPVVGAPSPPVDPVGPEALEYLLTRLCGGCRLVGFGRVLQGGLLPTETLHAAASVQCAWRRFLKVSRRWGHRPEWRQPLTLDDALEIAGLPPVDSEDAAMRALAIRDLWGWMDRVE